MEYSIGYFRTGSTEPDFRRVMKSKESALKSVNFWMASHAEHRDIHNPKIKVGQVVELGDYTFYIDRYIDVGKISTMK